MSRSTHPCYASICISISMHPCLLCIFCSPISSWISYSSYILIVADLHLCFLSLSFINRFVRAIFSDLWLSSFFPQRRDLKVPVCPDHDIVRHKSSCNSDFWVLHIQYGKGWLGEVVLCQNCISWIFLKGQHEPRN